MSYYEECQHRPHEDHLIWSVCGQCRQDPHEDDIWSSCCVFKSFSISTVIASSSVSAGSGVSADCCSRFAASIFRFTSSWRRAPSPYSWQSKQWQSVSTLLRRRCTHVGAVLHCSAI